MTATAGLALVSLALATVVPAVADADDRLDLTGSLDLRFVHATGERSWLDGGSGVLRFDREHEDLRLGRAFVAGRLRLDDTLSLHAVVDAYGDHDRNPVDLSEFWLEYRPFPLSPLRWRARLGAFYAPISLENRGPGWTDVYTITPSAINTWIGEEFRTLGAEVEARWLGSARGDVGDLALVAAAYGWNDPAGALLSDRGFGLTDRSSTLFGGLGRPPLTFYHDTDHRAGYYAGLSWRRYDRAEVRALHYDNRADPTSVAGAAAGWLTRFDSVGVRLEPTSRLTLIAQNIDGETVIGPFPGGAEPFRMTFRATFGLASLECGPTRVTARYDDFHTHQLSGFYGPPADQVGHAWTVAVQHDVGEAWQVAAEWIRVTNRFPPRAAYGVPADGPESQLQLALRYRFRLQR
jgi:hypothetical protein